MSSMLTIARKELRALFQSPVAMIFLGVFLAVTLFTFFSTSRFFARNLADVRPLFEWLPLLLIFLVSATTMRSWAEEQRTGTLEVLLTLPVPTRDLVLGKFLAGMALVGVALALTLPLPLVVSTLGPLDWGPVIGGYLAAVLLGAAYMAIGLCVSARTDNQVVALMSTVVIGGAVYLVGTDQVASLFSNDGAEVVRALGTGSRFQSIERGVLDVRDLVYYGSITVFCLVLNGYFLDVQRIDAGSQRGARHRGAMLALLGLTALNAVAANLWLAPVTVLRADLTQNGDYSIGDATRSALKALDEPLTIHGYFSERTHPLLAPLIPQIRDMLEEYSIAGGEMVQVEFFDPSTDEELEQEIGERYSIRSFPFGVTDRHSQAVVNSFFHVLVQYGDEYEVLSFQDLIEVHQDEADLQVKLRNLEYDLTRTIKRVSQDFQSVESVLAKLPGQGTITAYITPATLPEDFQEVATAMRKVAGDIAGKSGGKIGFTEVDPDPALREQINEQFGVRPLAVDLLGREVFYLHLIIQIGEHVERVMPRPGMNEADLRTALEASIKRATPGQLKTLALVTEQPVNEPPDPRMPPQMQPPQREADFRGLQQIVREFYDVKPMQVEDGYVPDEIDVLVVGKTGPLTDQQKFAIDQYLMRGGSVIALAGAYQVSADRQGLQASPADKGLSELLAAWGVKVEESLVMDPVNAAFPVPVQQRMGQFTVQRIELIPYPMFPDVRGDGLNREHPALAGVNNVTVPWASPVSFVEETVEGREQKVLLTSSPEAWINATGKIEPDFQAFPDQGFGPSGEQGAKVLAVSATGHFKSYFADKPNPLFGEGEEKGTGRTLSESVADGRLVVVGSGELVSDIIVSLAQQPAGEVHRNNLQLLQNLVDWSVEDTELLSIRSSGAFARTLDPLTDDESRNLEFLVYGAVLVPLLVVVFVPRTRRSRIKPISLKAVEQA